MGGVMIRKREAIHEIINDAGGSLDLGTVTEKIDKYEKHLRAAGWINLDDVVEGLPRKCTRKTECPEGRD